MSYLIGAAICLALVVCVICYLAFFVPTHRAE